MAGPNGECCLGCYYVQMAHGGVRCVRHPPIHIPDGEHVISGWLWPDVGNGEIEWCGEFKLLSDDE